MLKRYDFSRSGWEDDFLYVYSPVVKECNTFRQDADSIGNAYSEKIKNFEYISIVTKKKYKSGVKIKTTCSFDNFGAPLIVFTNEINTDENSVLRYGLHFEVVAFELGCNVWHIAHVPDRKERPTMPALIAKGRFPLAEKEKVEICCEIVGRTVLTYVNGNRVSVVHADIPETFHVGITACEGINHFYELTIEE